MINGKARYQGGTQYGGPGESSGGTTEKIPYNQTMMKMFVAKSVDAGEAVAADDLDIPADHPNRDKLIELAKQVQ